MFKTNVRRHVPGHGPNDDTNRHMLIVQGDLADDIVYWLTDQGMAVVADKQPSPSSVREWWLYLNDQDPNNIDIDLCSIKIKFGGPDVIFYLN